MWLRPPFLRSPQGAIRALTSRGPFARRRLRAKIDTLGCPACGGHDFQPNRVIDDDLAAGWRLRPFEREWFDEREGHMCARCEMSKRVRMIVWTVRFLHLEVSSMDVLHINQVNNLSPLLSDARSLSETGFDPERPPNSEIDGLVNQDLCELTYPDRTFDLVIHSETLEHVFDYEQALREVRRVLRPGGLQIYTLPLLHTRRTIQRALRRTDGTTTHLRPPSYHGFESENLVVWEFGGDFIRSRTGLIHQIVYDDFFANPTVFAVVERVEDSDRDSRRGGPVSSAVMDAGSPVAGPAEAVQRRSHDDWHLRSKQVRALRQQINNQATAYAQIECGYREISRHNEDLEAEYRRLEDYAQRLESVIAALRVEIDGARNGNATAENYVASLEQNLQALSGEFNGLEEAYREICAYTKRVESELDARGNEYLRLESAYLNLLAHVDDLESAIRPRLPEPDRVTEADQGAASDS